MLGSSIHSASASHTDTENVCGKGKIRPKKEVRGRETRRLISGFAGEVGAAKKFLAFWTGADSSERSAQPEEEEEKEGWREG